MCRDQSILTKLIGLIIESYTKKCVVVEAPACAISHATKLTLVDNIAVAVLCQCLESKYSDDDVGKNASRLTERFGITANLTR